QLELPAAAPRPETVHESWSLLVVRDEKGRYLMERRDAAGPLRGLWSFPTVKREAHGRSRAGKRIGSVQHAIMNRRLNLEIVRAGRRAAESYCTRAPAAERRYVAPDEIRRLPRSSIVEKVLRKLEDAASGAEPPVRGRTGQ
ncbi:MAG: hypothetical protein GF355_14430, partial [Candidatus Eisenbacteria bacterium]|nr:hypothetical protein [Candidatus Eisenbacteria bacterium]